ncbi:unnamed protein product [Callosobruchus maculatus]|uniref:BZIP domain-containing protein n=1 Tax=Callosobruchus maculatus TaxID=64391 RepID=A0A653C3G0_CALMS|nr:unnamed protein product [Callosobruchus maculatus]
MEELYKREKQKLVAACYQKLDENTPPSSENEDAELLSNEEQRKKKILNRNKVRRYMEKQKMQQKLDALHKKLQMYKKRYHRLKKQTQKSKLNTNHSTPISRLIRLIQLLYGLTWLLFSTFIPIKE